MLMFRESCVGPKMMILLNEVTSFTSYGKLQLFKIESRPALLPEKLNEEADI